RRVDGRHWRANDDRDLSGTTPRAAYPVGGLRLKWSDPLRFSALSDPIGCDACHSRSRRQSRATAIRLNETSFRLVGKTSIACRTRCPGWAREEQMGTERVAWYLVHDNA